ncbi:MAG TPA: hypothetical protein VMP01_24330 [Pirellulaceae bacterium]|nr:hypothetical protein [Pirellulaceae bacterium]
MTLLEVLFAIMVAAVGLLGAIAVFPVALSQARKGLIADVTAVAGESAIATFQAEGMNQRARWIAWPNNTQAFVPPNFQSSSNTTYFGYAFCIDPMLFSHSADDDPGNAAVWSFFPAVPSAAAPNTRMRRLTLHNGNFNLPNDPAASMSIVQADKVFRIEDALLYERPSDNTLPAAQLFTTINDNGTLRPARRQEEGRLTWFATLVPKIDRLQLADGNGIARLGEEYVLSVVVCHNRPNGEGLHVNDDPANPEHPWNEWTAKILATDFHSDGIGGGEVTITTNDQGIGAPFNKEEYLNLRSGQWIMLGRTLPGGNNQARPIQHFQWYRVSDTDETISLANGRWSQDVSLIGPDWPADVQAPAGTNEECDVIIMPTVVHVYERTIKIETGALQ